MVFITILLDDMRIRSRIRTSYKRIRIRNTAFVALRVTTFAFQNYLCAPTGPKKLYWAP
jgi:hypothetical protein